VAGRVGGSQREAIRALGLSHEQVRQFFDGEPIVFSLRTESDSGIAFVEFRDNRLRCGVIEINDPGGGLKTLLRFRNRSQNAARALGLSEFELFGAAVINPRLQALLTRKGFVKRSEQCPDELGGGEMEVLSRIETIS
jgi:hypothetical protein